MKKNKWLHYSLGFFVAVVLIALLSLSKQGPEYIGKSYVDTDEFQ